MSRILIFVYGLLAYVAGMAGLVFFVLFTGDWDFMPFTINSRPAGELFPALSINVGLMLLFGVQHSVMARQGFKRAINRIIPEAAERSTYVLISGVLLVVIPWFWQPIEGALWRVETPSIAMLMTIISLLGWGIVVLSSFLINHFELFGLQQVYLRLTNRPEPAPHFTDRFLYKLVRHPLQLGVLIGLWVTPWMTTTHLMLAALMTVYIAIGLHYEEKDLVRALGSDYEDYQRRVPKVIPFTKRKSAN